MKNLFGKILVPIDGSKTADNALTQALKLAKIHGSVVEILHVMTLAENLPTQPEMSEKIDTPSEWVEEYLTLIRERDEKMLREAVLKANDAGLAGKVTSKLMVGKPGDVIIQEASQGAFDLIVIGNRGLSGVKEFVLGSVSHQVVDESNMPVLVVK